ncbi:hypothetical protein Leryth_019706 [Lithospermum erythrorhizon]|nr:hypothetical protein Leryth_019706 [Lithospermum erythrorhizon]
MSKQSSHRKNDSEELDVFEAARYFSDFHEIPGYNNNNNVSTLAQKIMRDERQPWRGGRISLDMPNIRNSLVNSQTFCMENQTTTTKERNKCKQPSSPGGKLANFLTSLFNQASSRKKKSKSTTQSLRDEDESPGGRRWRRSSISQLWSSSSNKKSGTKSNIYPSSSTSGFRTPPPFAYSQTKSYRDLQSYVDHHQVLSLNRVNDKKQVIRWSY